MIREIIEAVGELTVIAASLAGIVVSIGLFAGAL